MSLRSSFFWDRFGGIQEKEKVFGGKKEKQN